MLYITNFYTVFWKLVLYNVFTNTVTQK